MKVPLYYPFYPPEVRFLTRILHPNVSRHGDVGIDLILQHNWSCGMTLSKVLISIQVWSLSNFSLFISLVRHIISRRAESRVRDWSMDSLELAWYRVPDDWLA